MKIAELYALITLKGGKDAVSTLKGMVSTTIAVKSQLIGAAAALDKMSQVARESALFMDQYQLNTGLSTIQLQKLSFQAAQAGVSMTELGGAIQKLQQANAQARLGYGWDPIFTRLGLTPGQDPVTQLNQISSALRRMQSTNPAEAKYLASKAGISDSVYYAMLRGTTEEMNKQLILTDKEQKALVKLNQQWNKFWFYIKQIVIKLQALGASIQTGIVKLGIRAAQGFYSLCDKIKESIKLTEEMKIGLAAIGVALAAIFAPWTLGIGALLLVLDDLYAYFNGGHSITGEIVEWLNQSEEFKDVWEGIKDLFLITVEAIKLSFKGIKETLTFMKEIGVFEYLARIINEIVDGIAWLLRLPFVRGLLKDAGAERISDIAQSRLDRRFGAYQTSFTPDAISKLNQKGIVVNLENHTAFRVEGNNAQEIAETAMDLQKQLYQEQGQIAARAIGGDGGYTKYSNNKGQAKLALD